MMTPTREECERLLEEYCVPENVRRHCRLVSDIAVTIAKALREKGEKIDVDLLMAAGLLHDILRIMDFNETEFEMYVSTFPAELKKRLITLKKEQKGRYHGELAYIELKGRFPKIAKAILTHSYPPEDFEKLSIEQVVLNYADKRAENDTMVTINERYDHANIHRRWKKEWRDSIEKNRATTGKMEEFIFKKLDFKPEDLKARVENEG